MANLEGMVLVIKVPLACYSDKDKLTIVYNKQKHYENLPITPSCYIKEEFSEIGAERNARFDSYVDLYSKDPINVYKKDFKNTIDCALFFRKHKESGHVFALSYLEYLLIQHEHYFESFANTEPLTVMYFDIETWIEGNGRFSKAERDPITAIGYKINDEPTQVIDCYDDETKDFHIVVEFLKVIEKYDPDIVVGYNCLGVNGNGFDIPYIIKRAQAHGLNLTKLSRWGKSPVKENKQGGLDYKFYGRCIFDIFNFVLKDQSLSGIKNRKLETVSEWYGIKTFKWQDVYKINSANTVRTEKLREHVISDVDATASLFKIYFPVQTALANLMQIPLDTVVNSYASFIPKIFSGRHLMKNKIIPFESNEKRYSSSNLQAALIDIYKTGLHDNVWGIDATSFYPSIMRTFNISPDTVTLAAFLPKTDKPEFWSDDKIMWIKIPDNNFDKDILLKVDMTKTGFLKSEMDNFFDMRGKFKKAIVEQPELAPMFQSQSNAIKVIMNTVYGFNGLGKAWFGDLGTAIGITGLARWLLSTVIDYYKGNVIYFHTDGIYIDREPDLDGINKYVADVIHEHTNLPSRVSFELKGKYKGYFHKKGNYILKTEDGKLEIHGVSMKSSRAPKFYDTIIGQCSRCILDGWEVKQLIELAKNFYNLQGLTLEDFLQATKVTKLNGDLLEEEVTDVTSVYKNSGALQPTLMKRLKEVFNRDSQIGDQVDFFKRAEKNNFTINDINFDNFRKFLLSNNEIIKTFLTEAKILQAEIKDYDDEKLLEVANELCKLKTLCKSVDIKPEELNDNLKKLLIRANKPRSRLNINDRAILNRAILDSIGKDWVVNKMIEGGYVIKEEIKYINELDLDYYQTVAEKALTIFELDPESIKNKYGVDIGSKNEC